jgi:hypothetical protein
MLAGKMNLRNTPKTATGQGSSGPLTIHRTVKMTESLIHPAIATALAI